MSTGFTETRAEENTEIGLDFVCMSPSESSQPLKRNSHHQILPLPKHELVLRSSPVCVDDGAKVMLNISEEAGRWAGWLGGEI